VTKTAAEEAKTGKARKSGSTVGRIALWVLHELREAIVPTAYFFLGFNLIVLTTNLLVAQYSVAVSNFMLATVGALVVGKAVLVANALPFVGRFDRAPLLQPILYKTAIYWVVVFFVRILERFVRFTLLEGHPVGAFPDYLVTTFSWQRFVAISLWILVLFSIYVTGWEFARLLGPDELRRLLLTSRPSELQLDRRQRARSLLELSRLADAHSASELGDARSDAHKQLVRLIAGMARPPATRT
jgi:hypothetical protein